MQLLLEHIKIQPAQEKKRFNQFKKKKIFFSKEILKLIQKAQSTRGKLIAMVFIKC